MREGLSNKIVIFGWFTCALERRLKYPPPAAVNFDVVASRCVELRFLLIHTAKCEIQSGVEVAEMSTFSVTQ